MKKPMLSTALVNIPTKYVREVPDAIRLNADMASMRGSSRYTS